MQKSILRKGLVVGIILLFVGTSSIPSIIGNIDNQKQSTTSNQQSSALTANIDWWPMFRHDPNHTGFSTSKAPETNSTLWQYSTGDGVHSSPAIVDEKVYVGSYNGKVYCLDAITGLELWNYTTGGGTYGVVSSPAVVDGKVYVGSYDKKLYCLNADNGNKIWNYTTNNQVYSSPVVANGKVYVSSCDGYIYCLNADTGAWFWQYNIGSSYSSPAVANGKVYVGSESKKIYCLNADTGAWIWEYTTGNEEVFSSPAVANGKVYVGSEDNKIYCLNADTGAWIWEYTLRFVRSSPAIADDKVYIGSGYGGMYCGMYCLDADTGLKIWDYQTGISVFSSPAVADGKVYFGSENGKMYCLNANTGELIWDYQTGNSIVSSPAIAGGKAYIGSLDSKIYCFGGGNQPPAADFTWIPQNPKPGQMITFDASTSYDPDGTIELYEWDWNNDGIYDESHTTPTATHSWPSTGNYFVTLRVTDNNLTVDIETKTIIIESAVVDLTIKKIDIVQTIWNFSKDNDERIDLVAKKSTMARVTVGMQNYETLNKQYIIEVRLTFDNFDYFECRTIEQLEQNNQVDFYPGLPITTGDQTILVKVDPNNTINEVDDTNNEKNILATVSEKKDLHIVYFKVKNPAYDSGSLYDIFYPETVEKSGEFIQATYPIADGNLINQDTGETIKGHKRTLLPKGGIFRDCFAIAIRAKIQGADVGVGIVPSGYFTYHGIEAASGMAFPLIKGVVANIYEWTTPAHEVGHTYGLPPGFLKREEYNDNYNGNPASGFWVIKKQPMENLICFMGSEIHTSEFDSWICNDCYPHLFKKFS